MGEGREEISNKNESHFLERPRPMVECVWLSQQRAFVFHSKNLIVKQQEARLGDRDAARFTQALLCLCRQPSVWFLIFFVPEAERAQSFPAPEGTSPVHSGCLQTDEAVGKNTE